MLTRNVSIYWGGVIILTSEHPNNRTFVSYFWRIQYAQERPYPALRPSGRSHTSPHQARQMATRQRLALAGKPDGRIRRCPDNRASSNTVTGPRGSPVTATRAWHLCHRRGWRRSTTHDADHAG